LAQSRQPNEEPAVEYLPAAQLISQLALSFPRPRDEERPALQFLQDAPDVLHLPTAQFLQSLDASEPADEYLPAPHDVQEVAEILNWLAGHWSQRLVAELYL
jgi:hypothetical protein